MTGFAAVMELQEKPIADGTGRTHSAVHRPASQSALSLPAGAAAVAALIGATWLYYGYRYLLYPQTGFLDWVFRIRGDFTNDFHTDHAPEHWAFTHFLAVLPDGALEPALFAIWIAGLILLWGGALAIVTKLGAGVAAGLAAGIVLIPTSIAGFGTITMLFGYVYPTATSFGVGVVALAMLLRSRFVIAGALMGFATLVHPNLGVLMIGAFGPTLLYLSRGRMRRSLLEFGLPCLVIASLAIFHLLADEVSGAQLSTHQRFELLTVVRAPHHYLYSAYNVPEYVWTAAWTAVLGVALIQLRHLMAARAIALVAATILLMCGIGAIASLAGGPLFLVSALTARLSPFLTLLAALAAACVLQRAHSTWGPSALVAVFLLAPPINLALTNSFGWYEHPGSIDAVEAVLTLGLVASIPVVRRLSSAAGDRRPAFSPLLAAGVFAALVSAAGVSLAVKHDERVSGDSPLVKAFIDVSEKARAESSPSDLFLSPPDLDGFRTFAHRGTVTEFGTIEFAKGDTEWVRRMLAVTGDPRTVSPDFGSDVPKRVQLIANDYDKIVATSRLPVCRYRVFGVVARTSVKPPPWLVPVYRNQYFQLLKVAPGACTGNSYSARSDGVSSKPKSRPVRNGTT